MPRKEVKWICGKLHWQLMCRVCKEMVWTRSRSKYYVCFTCSNPRFAGGQLGQTPGEKVKED